MLLIVPIVYFSGSDKCIHIVVMFQMFKNTNCIFDNISVSRVSLNGKHIVCGILAYQIKKEPVSN